MEKLLQDKSSFARLLCVALAIALAVSSTAAAATYYVDPGNGSDSYDGLTVDPDGSSSGPFLTIQHALDLSGLAPGDTIYLRGGTYRGNSTDTRYRAAGNFTSVNGSADGGYITVAAYESERPIIKGSVVATDGWTYYSTAADGSTIWKYNSDWDSGDDYQFRYVQQVFVSSPQQYLLGEDGTTLQQISWIGIPWGLPGPDTSPYLGFSEGVGVVGTVGDMVANSFFYDGSESSDGSLYICLPTGLDPASCVVEVSTSTSLFYGIGGGSYIHLQGLTFRHSNSCSNVTFADPLADPPVVANYYPQSLVALNNHCIIEDCDIEWGDWQGVSVHGDCLFVNSIMSNNGDLGFGTQSAHVTVTNCKANSNNYRLFSEGYACGGTKNSLGEESGVYGPTMVIQGCEFAYNKGPGVWFDTCYQGVAWDGHNAIVIQDNYIHDNDTGILLEVSTDALIQNNVIYENGEGVKLDSCTYCKILNNTIAFTSFNAPDPGDAEILSLYVFDQGRMLPGGSVPYGSSNNTIEYNFFYNNVSISPVWMSANGVNAYDFDNVFDYNVYDPLDAAHSTFVDGLTETDGTTRHTFAEWQATTGFDAHSILGTPIANLNQTATFPSFPGANLSTALSKGYTNLADSLTGVSQSLIGGALATQNDLSQLQQNPVFGDASITGTLNITGDATFGGLTTNMRNLVLSDSSNLSVSCTHGSLTSGVAGGITFAGTQYTSEPTVIQWGLNASLFTYNDFGLLYGYPGQNGATASEPLFYVDGLNNRTSVGHTGASQPSGTATLNVEGTLGVSGNTSLANATLSGTLGVTGAATFSGGITFTGASTLANTSVGGTLGVTGTSSLAGASVSGDLGVAGNTTLSGNLDLSGTATLGDTAIYGQETQISPNFGTVGDTQLRTVILAGTESNASTVELTLDGATPGSTNRLLVPTNTSWAVNITVLGRSSVGATKTFRRHFVLKNVSGTVSFVGTEINDSGTADSALSAATLVDSADATNGSCKVAVTGAGSSGSVHWVARLEIVQTTY